jgi:hypothetical protein
LVSLASKTKTDPTGKMDQNGMHQVAQITPRSLFTREPHGGNYSRKRIYEKKKNDMSLL